VLGLAPEAGLLFMRLANILTFGQNAKAAKQGNSNCHWQLSTKVQARLIGHRKMPRSNKD
jgi:hypothetical protein